MAKGKKKDNLSLEEKLEQALVSVDEQPYDLPENWCWTYLENLCSIPITDGTHKTPTYCEKEEGYPFISAKDVTSGKINWLNIKYIIPKLHEELSSRLAPQKDDVLLAKNGTTGVAALVDTNKIFDLYVTLAVLRPNKNMILPQYMYYMINSPLAKKQFDEHLTGIGVPNLHLRDIKITKVVLPPIKEQQRIVEQIENLFSKLDEAKDKANEAKESFDLRKKAIYNKAFSGIFTKKWRNEKNISIDEWKQLSLNKVVNNLDSVRIPLSQSERENIDKVYDYYGASGVIDKVDNYLFDGRYLLIGEDGANLVTRSKPIAFIAEGKFWVNNHAHIFEMKEYMNMDFMCHYINSIDLIPFVTGSAQPKLSQKMMNKIPIIVPSVEEQEVIASIIDGLFEQEEYTKMKIDNLIEEINLMKKSILAKAFRGELGTNDLSEPSSIELLKEIL